MNLGILLILVGLVIALLLSLTVGVVLMIIGLVLAIAPRVHL